MPLIRTKNHDQLSEAQHIIDSVHENHLNPATDARHPMH